MLHTIFEIALFSPKGGGVSVLRPKHGEKMIGVSVPESDYDEAYRRICEVLDARTYDELIAGECRQPERPHNPPTSANTINRAADATDYAARDIIAAKDAHIADLQNHLGRLERLVYMLCEHLPEGDEE